MYQMAGSRVTVETKTIKKLLKSLSMCNITDVNLIFLGLKQGRKFNDPSSTKDIPQFIAFHNLALDESKSIYLVYFYFLVLDPLDSFKNFNEFFYRKLKADARQLASPDNPVNWKKLYFLF